MIDLTRETVLTLNQVARRLPSARRGKPVTLSCVLRWVLQGVKGPGGGTVRLEAVRLGGRWVTSVEALQRFAERQTPDPVPDPSAAPAGAGRGPDRRRRESERASAELDRLGL